MITLLRQNRFFYATYLVLFLTIGGLMLGYTKKELIHWVNDHNSLWADYLFSYVTNLGDGIFFVLIIVILLVVSRRMGFLALACFLLSSGLSIFFKRVVFPDNLRPVKYFAQSYWDFHLVKGVKMYEYNSFPSGHTISAFTVFGLLALLDKNKTRGVGWALLAASVGYSRVYLFEHFVEDAFAGSVIGVFTITVVYLAAARWWPTDTVSA